MNAIYKKFYFNYRLRNFNIYDEIMNLFPGIANSVNTLNEYE